jgi:hypothetical protein
VFVFKREIEAPQFQQALAARMQEGGLRLNLDKSGMIPFSAEAPKGRGILAFNRAETPTEEPDA